MNRPALVTGRVFNNNGIQMGKRLRSNKVDTNHRAIVVAMRQMGASVLDTHDLGKGAPDVIVGACGINVLVEIKNGDLPPSKQTLTEDEQIFHDSWRGQIVIIRSVAEAIHFINGIRRE